MTDAKTKTKRRNIVIVIIAIAVISIIFNYHFITGYPGGFLVIKKIGWGPKHTFVNMHKLKPSHTDFIEALTKYEMEKALKEFGDIDIGIDEYNPDDNE